MTTLQMLLKFGIGLLLIASGANHFVFPFKFLSSVLAYQFLSPIAAEFFSVTIPFVQLITGMALIAGIVMRGAWLVSALIFSLFLAAQSWALQHGLDINCGCFGSYQHSVSLKGCLLLAFLILSSCYGWYFEYSNKFPPVHLIEE